MISPDNIVEFAFLLWQYGLALVMFAIAILILAIAVFTVAVIAGYILYALWEIVSATGKVLYSAIKRKKGKEK